MAEKAISTIRAICFDFDGTLINSLPTLRDVYREFCSLHKIAFAETDFQRFNGTRLVDIVSELRLIHSIKMPADDLFNQYVSLIQDRYQSSVTLMPHTYFVLLKLREMGIRMALVTSGPRAEVDFVLSRFKLTAFFEVLVTAESFDRGKPDPQPYQIALERLHLNSEDVIAVEDSQQGVQSALGADLRCLWVGLDFSLLDVLSFVTGKRETCIPFPWVKDVSISEVQDAYTQSYDLASFWKSQRERNASLFDGPVFRFHSYEGGHLEGSWESYRVFLASRSGVIPDQVIPIGVTGIIRYESMILIARRSAHVATFPGFYEVAPSGGISERAERIDIRAELLRELHEETGIEVKNVEAIEPVLSVYDPDVPCFDLVMNVFLNPQSIIPSEVESFTTEEHDELRFIPLAEVGTFLIANSHRIIPASEVVMQYCLDQNQALDS